MEYSFTQYWAETLLVPHRLENCCSSQFCIHAVALNMGEQRPLAGSVKVDQSVIYQHNWVHLKTICIYQMLEFLLSQPGVNLDQGVGGWSPLHEVSIQPVFCFLHKLGCLVIPPVQTCFLQQESQD